MTTCRIASVVCLAALAFCSTAAAEPPIKNAAVQGSGPYADGKVIQAVGSGTIASRALKKTSFQASQGQVKFEVQILSVDSETRDKIYAELGAKNVQTHITTIGDTKITGAGEVENPARTSRHTITAGSVISTAVMDQDQVEKLYALAKESDTSKVIGRPVLIAADGQPASFQQQVQRPFLSGLQRVEHGDESGVQSEIQVLNEGTEVTVLADADGDALAVEAQIRHSKVADVKHHQVYGIGEAKNTIQVPSHEVRQATAREKLMPKQTLLLDPYFQTKQVKETTTSAPILDQLPYVGSSFVQVETEEVTMNTIVLLKAKRL